MIIKCSNHFKLINYLKTDEERQKNYIKKTENLYDCKIIGSTEQKLKIINQIERDYDINIQNEIINNNSTEVEFNRDFYKLIVNVFQTKKNLPTDVSDVVNLHISMLKHTYGDIISKNN